MRKDLTFLLRPPEAALIEADFTHSLEKKAGTASLAFLRARPGQLLFSTVYVKGSVWAEKIRVGRQERGAKRGGDIRQMSPGPGLEPGTAALRTIASAHGRTLSPLHHQRRTRISDILRSHLLFWSHSLQSLGLKQLELWKIWLDKARAQDPKGGKNCIRLLDLRV
ncbi:hypothetical protein CHARACLAT_003057 [Characodon lateralis]|uniref:Uncharacterized protein n=1 Tax=Characodon lateralis TaxID=208331 RepID=A0ABU7EIR8_9TELE|nr:hypothetical protein [Characodon lateralis]